MNVEDLLSNPHVPLSPSKPKIPLSGLSLPSYKYWNEEYLAKVKTSNALNAQSAEVIYKKEAPDNVGLLVPKEMAEYLLMECTFSNHGMKLLQLKIKEALGL